MKLQQGDVILRAVSSLPKVIKPVAKKSRGFVLAEGEHTGHAHCITDEGVEMYEDSNGTLFLKVIGSATLKHTLESGLQADHNPILIDPGIWQIDRVREFDSFTEEITRVQD